MRLMAETRMDEDEEYRRIKAKLDKGETLEEGSNWCKKHQPQHFLYFFPLPQGHGSFLPALTFSPCFDDT